MDRCDFYSDDEFRQAQEMQKQEYEEEQAKEEYLQELAYFEYLLKKETGLTTQEIKQLKAENAEYKQKLADGRMVVFAL